MGWRRLPTYFVNFPLRLLPLSEKQQKIYEATGHLSEVAFKTTPKAGKVSVPTTNQQEPIRLVDVIKPLSPENRPEHTLSSTISFAKASQADRELYLLDGLLHKDRRGPALHAHACAVTLDSVSPTAVLQLEIRQYLERVYGLDVAKVRTLNYEGKKKQGKYGFYRRSDYKKAYVTLRPPAAAAAAAPAS